ncbi:MAG: hypothetical protein VX809_08965, partial [Pseudomonadota bacterium]|nr:hypothetical protein [Pseudomonadota bacterium]
LTRAGRVIGLARFSYGWIASFCSSVAMLSYGARTNSTVPNFQKYLSSVFGQVASTIFRQQPLISV